MLLLLPPPPPQPIIKEVKNSNGGIFFTVLPQRPESYGGKNGRANYHNEIFSNEGVVSRRKEEERTGRPRQQYAGGPLEVMASLPRHVSQQRG
jgi:hypothetical protein